MCSRPAAGRLCNFLTRLSFYDTFCSETLLCCDESENLVRKKYAGSLAFLDFLFEFGLHPSVNLSTHEEGNILDLIIAAQRLDISAVDSVISVHK